MGVEPQRNAVGFRAALSFVLANKAVAGASRLASPLTPSKALGAAIDVSNVDAACGTARWSSRAVEVGGSVPGIFVALVCPRLRVVACLGRVWETGVACRVIGPSLIALLNVVWFLDAGRMMEHLLRASQLVADIDRDLNSSSLQGCERLAR